MSFGPLNSSAAIKARSRAESSLTDVRDGGCRKGQTLLKLIWRQMKIQAAGLIAKLVGLLQDHAPG